MSFLLFKHMYYYIYINPYLSTFINFSFLNYCYFNYMQIIQLQMCVYYVGICVYMCIYYLYILYIVYIIYGYLMYFIYLCTTPTDTFIFNTLCIRLQTAFLSCNAIIIKI